MIQQLSAAVAAACVLLTGCASIVGGQNQSLSVRATAAGGTVNGATCSLSNDKGTWYLTTPGSAVVQRSFAELSVSCEKDDFEPGLTAVKSSTKALAFGNILFGGVIGASIDIATGAAYDYPTDIMVPLTPRSGGEAVRKNPAVQAAARQAAVAEQAVPVAQAGFMEYRVVDRLTRTERKVRVDATTPALTGTGDLELLAPPEGWAPPNLAAGQRWTLKYAAKDGPPASTVAIEGQAGASEPISTQAGQFNAVPITYKGWIDRAAGPFMVALPAEFRLWVDSDSRRVLKFESDVQTRSAGPNQAAGSKETLELTKVGAAGGG